MPIGFLPRIPLIHQYLEQLKPDLVHGQGTEREFGVTAVTSRFPSVLTVHGILSEVCKVTRPPWISPLHVGRWVERVALRKARQIIAISSYVDQVLAAKTRAEFHHVPNAVAPVFYEVSKERLAPRVVYSAVIAPRKGLWDLLQAAHRLQVTGVKAQWEILGAPFNLGGTPYFSRCREFARENLKGQQTEFRGWSTQEEFAEALGSASCFALPSYWENSPTVIAEAMASGTPVVAYAVGGIPDLVEDGVQGFLVPPGDIRLLAQRVEELVSNPNMVKAMGERAREKAQAFRPSDVAAKTLAVYEQILRNN
jgi:glycosyltransferase involved in cell wall biosynthesis